MSLEEVQMGTVNITRPKITSDSKMIAFSTVVSFVSDGPRCLPMESVSTLPRPDIKAPTHREHPIEMSSTVDVGLRAKEPVNGSSLVTECPHGYLSGQEPLVPQE